MLLSLRLGVKFLQLLNSETSAVQLAAGFAFGVLVGFLPFWSVVNLLLFLVVCFFRVNLTMFFLSSALFSLLAFALDPVFDGFGYWILVDWLAARELWIWIASQPLLPFLNLNNTVMMGSLALGLLLFLPTIFLTVVMIKRYRASWREQIKNSAIYKILRASKMLSPVFSAFEKYQKLQEKFGDQWGKIV